MKQQPNPTDAEQTDALVDMIEQLMENGSGHLVVSEQDSQEGLRVDTYRSTLYLQSQLFDTGSQLR